MQNSIDKTRLSIIQNVLDEMVSTRFISGANCLVYKDGVEQGYFESGYSDLDENKPISRGSLFRLYSMSKTVTSVATHILVEQGKIDLFEDVANFLPGFRNPRYVAENGDIIDSPKPVRIIDLLSMTSGIPYSGDSSSISSIEITKILDELISRMDGPSPVTTVDFANRIGQCPLEFEPGSHFKYGFSADILGAVIEVASGIKFSSFLKKNIFEPLHMDNTDFYVPSVKQDLLAKVYEDNNGQLGLYTFPHLGVSNTMTRTPGFESGGAGLCSAIDDFVPFTQMLLNGGSFNGERIISPETVKYISSYRLAAPAQVDFDTNWSHLSGHSYGNLMRIMTDPSRAVTLGSKGEFGWDGWLGTYVAIDPANNLSYMIMMQRRDTGTSDYTRKIRNIIYSSLL